MDLFYHSMDEGYATVYDSHNKSRPTIHIRGRSPSIYIVQAAGNVVQWPGKIVLD